MTTMDLKRVADVAAGECIRQGVGVYRLGGLLMAYGRAWMFAGNEKLPEAWTLLGVDGLARQVEPDNGGRYRTLPASFADQSTAIPAGSIPRAMETWFAVVGSKNWSGAGEVDGLVKEFLDIHPFSDGNGRLAWLIRTWLLDQWGAPEPLPDYYGTP
jgi:hypothetical protein